MIDSQGRIQTEYSIGIQTPQGLLEIPSIYPEISLEEVKKIRSGKIDQQIAENARRAAQQRMQEGVPVFADTDIERIIQMLFYRPEQ